MADQLDTFGDRAVHDIDPRSILLLLVENNADQAAEIVAEVPGHGDGFEEDFRKHHGAAQVEPDSVLQRRNNGAQPAKIDKGSFAKGGAGDMGMHVHGVRAKSDVDGAGNAGAMRRQNKAGLRMAAADVIEVAAQGGPQSQLILGTGAGRHREGIGRLAGHAELSGGQGGGHVLAGLPGQRQLAIVNRRRPVQHHGAHQAAALQGLENALEGCLGAVLERLIVRRFYGRRKGSDEPLPRIDEEKRG